MIGLNVKSNIRRFGIPFTNSCICKNNSKCYIEDNVDPYLVPDSVESLTSMKGIRSEIRLRRTKSNVTKSSESLNSIRSFISDFGGARKKKTTAERCVINFPTTEKNSTAVHSPGLELSPVSSKVNMFPTKPTAEELCHDQRNVMHFRKSVRSGGGDLSEKFSGHNLKKVKSVRAGFGIVMKNLKTGATVRDFPIDSSCKSKAFKSPAYVRESLRRHEGAQSSVHTVKTEFLTPKRSSAAKTLQDLKCYESVMSKERILDKNLTVDAEDIFFSKVHIVKSEGLGRNRSNSNSVQNIKNVEAVRNIPVDSSYKSKACKSPAYVRESLRRHESAHSSVHPVKSEYLPPKPSSATKTLQDLKCYESVMSKERILDKNLTVDEEDNFFSKVRITKSEGLGPNHSNSNSVQNIKNVETIRDFPNNSKAFKSPTYVRESLRRHESAHSSVHTVKSEYLPPKRSSAGKTLQDLKCFESVMSKERILDKNLSVGEEDHIFSKVHTVKSEGLSRNRSNLNSVQNVKNVEPTVQKKSSATAKDRNLKNVHTPKSEAVVWNRSNGELKVVRNYSPQQIKHKVETVKRNSLNKSLNSRTSYARLDDEIVYVTLPDYSCVKAKVQSFPKDPFFTRRVKKDNKTKSESEFHQKKSKSGAVDQQNSIDRKSKRVQPEKSKSYTVVENIRTTQLPKFLENKISTRASAFWQLPKVAKEIYNRDPRIQILALKRLSCLLLSELECKRATFEFEIVQRLQNILLRFRVRKQNDQELSKIVLQCLRVLVSTLRGAIEMAKNRHLINELYIMAEEDAHSQMASCILQVLTTHPIVIKYFIEQTQWFCVLSRIMKNNLLSRLNKKLLEHFSHFIEIHPQMGINNGFFEVILSEMRVRQANQQTLLKCFAYFLNCEEGLRLLEQYDGIGILYQILKDDHVKRYEYVALAIKAATATNCRSRHNCQNLPLLVDTLIQRAVTKCTRLQQLYCLQILRQITNKPTIRKFVRKRYVASIKNIKTHCKIVKEAKKDLLAWIRRSAKQKRKRKSKSTPVTCLELKPFRLGTDESESKELSCSADDYAHKWISNKYGSQTCQI